MNKYIVLSEVCENINVLSIESLMCVKQNGKDYLWLFSNESKSVQFEWSFELRNLNDHSNGDILDRVYAKLHRDALFEMCNSNDGPDRHLNCAIQITHGDVILCTHGPKYRHSNDTSNSNDKSNCAIRMIIQIACFWSRVKTVYMYVS